jgi:hypothetical protein
VADIDGDVGGKDTGTPNGRRGFVGLVLAGGNVGDAFATAGDALLAPTGERAGPADAERP